MVSAIRHHLLTAELVHLHRLRAPIDHVLEHGADEQEHDGDQDERDQEELAEAEVREGPVADGG